ncbi:hypothetical protein VNO77_16746 [Canavalia gladiata]|uniref:Pentatricopeptide repeat-containing protein n=1 Tax=Canavalia gladiata TaxID=3824 RepID=A0AAN9QI38_CANGL
MKVACCTPGINVPYVGTPGTRFDSQEAHAFLQRCGNFKQLKQIHGRIFRFGLTNDQEITRKFLRLSSSYGKMNYATLVFDQLNYPDIFTWNVMIRAYTVSGSPEKALLMFKAMLCQGFVPNKYTYPFLINACIASSSFDFGRVVHALAIRMGFWNDLYVQNTMIKLYFNCENGDDGRKVFDKMPVRDVFSWTTVIAGLAAYGQLETARKLFEQMPSKNVVSWTAMMDGYVKHRQPLEAFNLFERMQVDNVKPNEYTVLSLVRACTEMGRLKLGRRIHDFALKNGLFELHPYLSTALIHMYSKCGSLDDARAVFNNRMTQVRHLSTWNAMISTLDVYGHRNEAISLFKEMEKANVVPDAITFVGVLSACAHMNDLEQGQKYFTLMTDHYGITPNLEHYTSMVELYTRANKTHKLGNARELLMETNHNVAELLQERKLTNIDDIKKLIYKHYGDSGSPELVLDHSATSSPLQLQSSRGMKVDISQTSR